MKIYSTKKKIALTVGEVTFVISPLSLSARLALADFIQVKGGFKEVNNIGYAYKALQLSLKEIRGLENEDGTPYELKFDDEGIVTDECMGEVSQVAESPSVAAAAMTMLQTMQDPKIDGVTVQFEDEGIPTKKK